MSKHQSSSIHQAVRNRDVPSLLSHWEQHCPDKPFLIWAPFEGEDKIWTYQEIGQDARRLAQGLSQRGISKGDKVLIHLDNRPEFILSWYACALIGAVAVTTNTRSVQTDIDYYVQKAEVVAVLSQDSYEPLFSNCLSQLSFIALTERDDELSFKALFADTEYRQTERHDTFDDFSIQFTSGTTSKPKAVVWTHGNAVWGALCNARNLGLQHDDICQAFLPLFHTNNQSYSLLGSLWVGGSYILQPRFSKTHFWRPALEYKASWASMIPFCLKALAEAPVPEHSFRFWAPAVTLPSFEEHFKVKTIGLYGMTETITQPIVCDTGRTGPEMSIGRPCNSYEISIIKSSGEPIEEGETGDLYIRGVRGISLFKEYLNDPQATKSSFDDDWFDTGDRIRMDDNGDLFFADRNKDMLKVGGENVAASEIEQVIMASGLVSEVAVVGQPHSMLDEVPVAFVIPNPDVDHSSLEQQLLEHCKTLLADFKVIKSVHIETELPRSLLNKISKKELRDRLEEIRV